MRNLPSVILIILSWSSFLYVIDVQQPFLHFSFMEVFLSLFELWLPFPMWIPTSPHLGYPFVWMPPSLCSGSNIPLQAAFPQECYPQPQTPYLNCSHPAWTPSAQALTLILSPPPTCRWPFYPAMALTLDVGLLPPPIPHTGLPTPCHVDSILTLVRPHLPTMEQFIEPWHSTLGHNGPPSPLTQTPFRLWST